jgi:hypothetical protein
MGFKTIARSLTALAAIMMLVVVASAQQDQTIEPGMTVDQVKLAFGEPQSTSSYGNHTFYFYENGCHEECGMADVVFFQNGQVVDAVLRAPWRSYAGESSSPKGVMPRATPGGERLQVPPNQVQGVEVRPARVPTPQPIEDDTLKADTTGVGG